MTFPVPINLVVEDILSESILRNILGHFENNFIIGTCYGQTGKGYIKKNINGFNNAAKGIPYLVLTDLDREECPPSLFQEWFNSQKHPNLIFRVAVKEVESWLLAHKEAMAKFLS